MATEEQKKELLEKVGKLVKDKFAGDYHQAFIHYDNNKSDGKINKVELVEMLKDADIGNWVTRGSWAEGIIEELDVDKDGMISAAEFDAVLK